MNDTKQPEALRKEYRATMPTEVLHLWAKDALECMAQQEAQHQQELRAYDLTVQNLRAELVKEAARTAEEKLRADQMTEQHRMQCNMRQESQDVLDAAKDHIRDLEAQLSAVGAGGVESLRKNGAARGQSGFEAWWRDKYPSFAMRAPDVWEAAMHHAAQPARECMQQSADKARALFEEMGCIADDEKCIAILAAALQAAPPAPAAVAVPDEREAFDKWFVESRGYHPLTNTMMRSDAWEPWKAWQARAALAAAPAPKDQQT